MAAFDPVAIAQTIDSRRKATSAPTDWEWEASTLYDVLKEVIAEHRLDREGMTQVLMHYVSQTKGDAALLVRDARVAKDAGLDEPVLAVVGDNYLLVSPRETDLDVCLEPDWTPDGIYAAGGPYTPPYPVRNLLEVADFANLHPGAEVLAVSGVELQEAAIARWIEANANSCGTLASYDILALFVIEGIRRLQNWTATEDRALRTLVELLVRAFLPAHHVVIKLEGASFEIRIDGKTNDPDDPGFDHDIAERDWEIRRAFNNIVESVIGLEHLESFSYSTELTLTGFLLRVAPETRLIYSTDAPASAHQKMARYAGVERARWSLKSFIEMTRLGSPNRDRLALKSDRQPFDHDICWLAECLDPEGQRELPMEGTEVDEIPF